MNRLPHLSAHDSGSAVEPVPGTGRFSSGGINLSGASKGNVAAPVDLVNFKDLPETNQIDVGEDECVIGANVTLASLAGCEPLVRVFPALVEAASEAGSPQTRNASTVGGDLSQPSRCSYYRQRGAPCVKKGGVSCFARVGENRFHSLFTGCMCVSPAVSSVAIALAALDARIAILSDRRIEKLTVAQFFASAWSNPAVHNSLKPADQILRVEIPVVNGVRSAYLEVSEKSDFDWALVSCATAARVNGRAVNGVRIVVGAIAPIPWQVAQANRFLEGRIVNDDVATQAASLVLREAAPLSSNGYKLPIARALIRRCLTRLVA
jgi:xanthine dehydrogenase YagS FAD-binding subunit